MEVSGLERPGGVPIQNMRTSQLLRVVGRFNRRHRTPADRSQPGCRPTIMAEREKKLLPVIAIRGTQRIEQRVHVKRKTCRSFFAPANSISPTSPKRAARSVAIKREAEPALVFETMPFRGIERYPCSLTDRRRNRPQTLDPAGQRAARIKRGELVDGRRKVTRGTE